MRLQLFAQEKTEAATPRKRQEARRRGQVFRSTELTGAVTLLTAALVLRLTGGPVAGRVLSFSRTLWAEALTQDWSEAGVRLLMTEIVLLVAAATGPILLAAAAAGVTVNLIQVGVLFTAEPLMPKWERISPASGFKRLFSRRTVMELVKALFKIGVIGWIAYRTVAGDLDQFPMLLGMDLTAVLAFLSGLLMRMLLWVGLAMLLLALADFAYQRYEHEQSLKMTRQEVKDEFRQTEGSPEVRGLIRQRQREMARRRMMQDVPRADVVITNPTHYAVALQYRQSEMAAPVVLAKGPGHLALKIRELAQEHGVPVVEDPPLARALFRSAAVGEPIPLEFYQAIAEVLAFVYRLKGPVR